VAAVKLVTDHVLARAVGRDSNRTRKGLGKSLVGAAVGRGNGAGREQGELRRIPSIERQLANAGLLNHLPHGGRHGVNLRRVTLHFNDFVSRTDSELQIQGQSLVGEQGHVLPGVAEASCLGDYGVLRGTKRRQHVVAFTVGCSFTSKAGADLRHCDLRCSDSRTGRISNCAGNASQTLCVRHLRQSRKDDQTKTSEDNLPLHACTFPGARWCGNIHALPPRWLSLTLSSKQKSVSLPSQHGA